MESNNPLDGLRSLVVELRTRLFTEAEFTKAIVDILDSLGNLRISAELSLELGETRVYGSPSLSEDQPLETRILRSGELGSPVSVKLSAWTTEPYTVDSNRSIEAVSVFDLLREVFQEHWAKRDNKGLVPRVGEPSTDIRLERALATACDKNLSTVGVRIDLDKFKAINTEFQYDGGDAVIREFGQRLRSAFENVALIVRRGGDEFDLYFIDADGLSVLRGLDDFRLSLATKPFSAIGRPNTCTMSVVLFPIHFSKKMSGKTWVESFDDCFNRASTTDKADRNQILLAEKAPPTSSDATYSLDEILGIASLWARQALAGDLPPFNNDLYNFLALRFGELASGSSIGLMDGHIQESIRVWGLKLRAQGFLESSPESARDIHVGLFGAVVLHGILRSSLVGKGLNEGARLFLGTRSNSTGEIFLLVKINNVDGSVETVSIGECGEETEDLFVGQPWFDASLDKQVRRIVYPGLSLAPVVLVTIGEESLGLPFIRGWAAGIVFIDSRPITGGGLPDFWQSNLSRIIESAVGNPNVRTVIIVGNENHATRTVKLLRAPESWNSYPLTRLAYQMGLDAGILEDYRHRGINVITAEPNFANALAAFRSSYFSLEGSLDAVGLLQGIVRPSGRPRMKVRQENPDLLVEQDGIRCSSLADAYPRVLQLLRSLERSRNRDHMGREFVELAGFKVVLEQPNLDAVPDYWSNEKGEFESYFESEFQNSNGIFGRRLQRWGSEAGGTDQLDRAIESLASAIVNGIATRRTTLFIAEPSSELVNLGLVCVQIHPRRREERWVLEFQWIWRTVEALVGFPFSAYGSIAESRFILDELNSRMRADGKMAVSLGQLVYIALSLHMFTDEGDMRIARAVVTAAIE